MGMALPQHEKYDLMDAVKFITVREMSEVKEQMYDLGYEQCKRDVLAIVAEYGSPIMLKKRNEMSDRISKLTK